MEIVPDSLIIVGKIVKDKIVQQVQYYGLNFMKIFNKIFEFSSINYVKNIIYYISDGLEIQEQAIKYYQQTIFDKLLQWSCADECQYGCMWRTVDAFIDRGWPIPQFYGKVGF